MHACMHAAVDAERLYEMHSARRLSAIVWQNACFKKMRFSISGYIHRTILHTTTDANQLFIESSLDRPLQNAKLIEASTWTSNFSSNNISNASLMETENSSDVISTLIKNWNKKILSGLHWLIDHDHRNLSPPQNMQILLGSEYPKFGMCKPFSLH